MNQLVPRIINHHPRYVLNTCFMSFGKYLTSLGTQATGYVRDITTNMLKAYLSTQPSSLTAFMIKTHTVAQKPRKRQLNTKLCSSKSAIFLSV